MDNKRELPRDTDFYALDNLREPISDEAAFTEIANALLRLRAAFIKAGFNPPKSLELVDHKDGYRFRHIMPRDMIAGYAAESLRGEDDTDVVMNLTGIEIRYPAGFRKLHRGRVETI